MANFMNPCENLCEGEYCVGGDTTNYFTGTCEPTFGCTALNQTNPAEGTCQKLPTCNNYTAGCYNNATCDNMCEKECCGANCTGYVYNSTGYVNAEPWSTGSCISHGYHCFTEIDATNGKCKVGQHDREMAGAISICLLLLIIICLCGCCGYCHHRRVKQEKEAVHEAMIANEEAQASTANMGE